MDGPVRIGELARRTGVSPELLRAWELRYGLLEPSRSAGGYRLYTGVDEDRVRRMTRLLTAGLSAAEAARQTLTADVVTGEERPAAAQPVVGRLAEQLQTALDAFDDAGAHAALDRLLASISLESVLGYVVIPYLHDLGDRWADGRASVAQEHFATNLIRGRLLGLARDWGANDGSSVLLACPPGEAHDVGLIIFGLLIARRGWRVTFLGADTPFDTLRASIRALRPSLVVLAPITPDRFHEHTKEIEAIAAKTPTALAGIIDERAVMQIGAIPLTADIVDASRTLTLQTPTTSEPGPSTGLP